MEAHKIMRVIMLLIMVLTTGALAATESHFQSKPQQTSLLELYTSEGCSSCPPAEAWFSRLKEKPGLWKDFVPIAFHVDYWNYLGWHDRFSAPQWTERQKGYARLWGSESVYTPAVAVNGHEERNWAETSLAPNEKRTGSLGIVTLDNKSFAIEFRPENMQRANWQAHLALLACDLSSDVNAGENKGRKLGHDFVVLGLRSGSLTKAGDVVRGSLTIPEGDKTGARLAVAVWITGGNDLTPIQATGGWLQ